ncbi:hypothetical protein QFC19_003055 [Naganishia cerealis]|uniref:Uncharacterized protein n=1 Tax=Naganishia cerealis TaxID=610337 RepID=A0ACC2W5R2_9TREE|nr:hypothetical protein QFC19_003055 [Naganishia cerealis]
MRGIYLSPEPTLALYERQIAPLVAKAMAGFNSTIFAYGQTGSGKTHTMSGTSDDVGIIPLAVSGVFEAIEQIYNETLRDMLRPSRGLVNDKDRPVIHVVDGNVVVRPLQEEIVRTPEEVLGLLDRGQRNRRTGATDWTIESRDGEDLRQSRLSLIDLAGSEKAASNLERLAEGKHINRSLLALGTVIELLSDKNRRPEILSSHSNPTLTTTSSIGQLMRRRVSDFIRAHPEKVSQISDPATPSRRAVSSKFAPIDEDDSSDNNISSDLIQAFRRQRSADKESHNMLLARLTAAESVTTEVQTMKQQIEHLKQCLLAESARSQKLMDQLLGRDKLEAQQNKRIRDLEIQLTAAVAEGDELRSKRSLSQPATLPSLNGAGLPSASLENNHTTSSSKQKLSEPLTSKDHQGLLCSTCEQYRERSRTQETIIQGQQSANRALMGKVAEWQQSQPVKALPLQRSTSTPSNDRDARVQFFGSRPQTSYDRA